MEHEYTVWSKKFSKLATRTKQNVSNVSERVNILLNFLCETADIQWLDSYHYTDTQFCHTAPFTFKNFFSNTFFKNVFIMRSLFMFLEDK